MARRPSPQSGGGSAIAVESQRRISPLVLAVFVLIAGFAALVGWLQLSYEDAEPSAVAIPVEKPEVVVTLSATPSTTPVATLAIAPPEKTETGGGVPSDQDLENATPPSQASRESAAQPPGATKNDGEEGAGPAILPPPPAPTAKAKADASAAPSETAAPIQATPDARPIKRPPDEAPGARAPAATSETPTNSAAKPDHETASATVAGPTPVWRQYARPFAAKAGWPKIAIVIWDLGLSRKSSTAAIDDLPGEVTLGLSPVARNPQAWADQARKAGHEVLLQVPMEPLSYPDDDPGPDTLLTFLSSEENQAHLERLLALFEGYIGIANYMGSRFTSSERDMRPVLETLKARGLIFLDSRAASNSVAFRIAGEIGLDRAANSRYIDNDASRSAIDARLAELERVARLQGSAVGIGAPYPVTIERLTQWSQSLAQRGIHLAPLSAVVQRGNAG